MRSQDYHVLFQIPWHLLGSRPELKPKHNNKDNMKQYPKENLKAVTEAQLKIGWICFLTLFTPKTEK